MLTLLTYDSSGNLPKNYEYDAFGNEKSPVATDTNYFRYCGEYYDKETGDYYLRARYYDPTLGRFSQEDSFRDGLNWYVYCGNNPIRFIDPSGRITQEEMDMYENGQMAPMAYSYLMHLTYQWYLADDQESKEFFHALAEEFREMDYKTTAGLFPEVDEGIAFMSKRPSGWNGVVPLTIKEHYFRNSLNINFSWGEFQKLNARLPENMQWTTVIASMHQHHTVNGIENIKYVSADGHFEIIYNGAYELLTSENNPDDMGTYNYYSPIVNPYYHAYYDVIPYGEYGNVG